MLLRVAVVMVVRQASRSAFKLPPIKFRHSSLTSQNESVSVITSPISHTDRKTQKPDRDRNRRKGKERVQKKQKSSRQPQTRHEKSLLISEDCNASANNAESFKQPQTRNEKNLWMSEDSHTIENDTESPERPRKIKSSGTNYNTKTRTKFTTKSPSQSVEDTLASMGINVKGEILFGIFPVLLAFQAKRRTIHQLIYKSGSGNVSDRIHNILTIAEEQGVPVMSLKPSQFRLIFQGDQVHQGVCCDASPLPFVTLDEDHPEQQGGDEQGRHQAEEEGKQQESSQAGRKNQGEGEQGGQQAGQEGKQQGEGEEESRHTERKKHQREREESQQVEEKNQQGKSEISQAGRKSQEEGDKYIHQAREKQQQRGEGEQESKQTGRERKQKLWLYLDQIQDPMNFGAVLRSAYFMGVDRVLTSEASSTRITSTVSKASAGVAEVFPVYQVKDPIRLASSLTQAGWELVSSASPGSSGGDDAGLRDVTAFHPKGNVLLIVGNEGKGISPELQQMCQSVLTIIPGRSLHPHLQSLNVSVATALLLHGLCQRLSPYGP